MIPSVPAAAAFRGGRDAGALLGRAVLGAAILHIDFYMTKKNPFSLHKAGRKTWLCCRQPLWCLMVDEKRVRYMP